MIARSYMGTRQLTPGNQTPHFFIDSVKRILLLWEQYGLTFYCRVSQQAQRVQSYFSQRITETHFALLWDILQFRKNRWNGAYIVLWQTIDRENKFWNRVFEAFRKLNDHISRDAWRRNTFCSLVPNVLGFRKNRVDRPYRIVRRTFDPKEKFWKRVFEVLRGHEGEAHFALYS